MRLEATTSSPSVVIQRFRYEMARPPPRLTAWTIPSSSICTYCPDKAIGSFPLTRSDACGDLLGMARIVGLRGTAPHRAPPLRSRADRESGDAEALRDRGGVDSAADPELAQDVRDVDARGLLRHEQCLADLSVRLAGGDKGQDFGLPWR